MVKEATLIRMCTHMNFWEIVIQCFLSQRMNMRICHLIRNYGMHKQLVTIVIGSHMEISPKKIE